MTTNNRPDRSSETLHEALLRCGYTHAKERDPQRHTIRRITDGVAVGSFDAHEAWVWLRQQPQYQEA